VGSGGHLGGDTAAQRTLRAPLRLRPARTRLSLAVFTVVALLAAPGLVEVARADDGGTTSTTGTIAPTEAARDTDATADPTSAASDGSAPGETATSDGSTGSTSGEEPADSSSPPAGAGEEPTPGDTTESPAPGTSTPVDSPEAGGTAPGSTTEEPVSPDVTPVEEPGPAEAGTDPSVPAEETEETAGAIVPALEVAPTSVVAPVPVEPAPAAQLDVFAPIAPSGISESSASPELPTLLPKLAKALGSGAAASPVTERRSSTATGRGSSDAEASSGASTAAPLPPPLRPVPFHGQSPSPVVPSFAPSVSSGGQTVSVRVALSGVLLIVAWAAFAQTIRVGADAPRAVLLAYRLPRPG
jgi:hypothetical protein